ncbi:MAG: tetratricopeptide repeat protein [Pirellulaceae bacterium]|nr:tetratricopeptide repeat protein [Pirellulaceae bacterium]
MGKAKNAVVSTFSTKTVENVDPETSLAHMPSNLGAEIWVTNGQIFEMKGNFNAALDNYTKALEKEPNNLAALQSTARLYMRQEQFASAIDFYQRAAQASPTAENYAELADALHRAGKLPEAQASIQKAISLDPTSTRYRSSMAGMLIAVGRSEEAVKQLEQVMPPALAHYNVAHLQASNKNPAAAQQHLQLALQLDPNLQPARELMAKITQNPTAQTAMAAYGTANHIYRTAQASLNNSAVSAGPTVVGTHATQQTGLTANHLPPPPSASPAGQISVPPLPALPPNF